MESLFCYTESRGSQIPVDRVKSSLGYFARFVLRLFSLCKKEYIVKEDLDTRDRSTPKNVTLIVLLEPYYSLHISSAGHY